MFGLFKYTYGVVTFDGSKGYHYRISSDKIHTGDSVIVPVGKYDAWKIGTVASIDTYGRFKVPYSLDKTKFIVELAKDNAEKKVEKHNKRIIKDLQREQKRRAEQIRSENKRKMELEWIDRIEEMDALFNDYENGKE